MKTDSEIYKAVMDELDQEPILKNTVIGIVVQHRVVTLYGLVNKCEKKSAAVNAVCRIEDVKAIADELEVRAVCVCTQPKVKSPMTTEVLLEC